MGSLPDVAPAAIVRDAPAVAIDDALSVIDTAKPVGPAWPFKVTLRVDPLPPVTELGVAVTLTTDAGTTVRVVDLTTPVLEWAESATVVLSDTPWVVMVAVPEEEPALMKRVDGTLAAAGVPLLRLMVSPVGPATPASDTVIVLWLPPTTDTGLAETVETDAGVTASVAPADPRLLEAVNATLVVVLTG